MGTKLNKKNYRNDNGGEKAKKPMQPRCFFSERKTQEPRVSYRSFGTQLPKRLQIIWCFDVCSAGSLDFVINFCLPSQFRCWWCNMKQKDASNDATWVLKPQMFCLIYFSAYEASSRPIRLHISLCDGFESPSFSTLVLNQNRWNYRF